MHWRRQWQPTPVFLPGESQGWGSLVGCRLWGRTELDTTEATQQHQQQWLGGKESTCSAGATGDAGFIPGSGRSPGRRRGYSLQYSCLENLMDRGAWRATVRGVPKSRTQLNRPSTHAYVKRSWCLCELESKSFFLVTSHHPL